MNLRDRKNQLLTPAPFGILLEVLKLKVVMELARLHLASLHIITKRFCSGSEKKSVYDTTSAITRNSQASGSSPSGHFTPASSTLFRTSNGSV